MSRQTPSVSFHGRLRVLHILGLAPVSYTAALSEGCCTKRPSLEKLACISHHPTVEARDTTARTSLRLLTVLNVLFKYACARQAARASS